MIQVIKMNAYINTVLSQYFEFKSFCPEVAIGLGIPRETIWLVTIDDKIRCVGTSTPTLDVTENSINLQMSRSIGMSSYVVTY